MPDLAPAVTTIVHRCLGVSPGEEVLVIADPPKLAIGEALLEESRRAGADCVLAMMEERATDGSEPPHTLAAALKSADVYLAPTSRSLSHTSARKQASDAGARGATMPGVTTEMLARVMAVDFDRMAERSRKVAELLDRGSWAHISCPRGSDATLDLSSRPGIADDGDLRARGAFGNLPCGEGFIAPLSGEGTIVASSVGSLGISEQPTILTVQGGQLVDAQEGLGPELLERLQVHGEDGANLAELGVGTNDCAQLTGDVLEDEKILGTVHVAFGASAPIGGTVSVPIHLDVVVLEASLEIDGQPVLEAGRFLLG